MEKSPDVDVGTKKKITKEEKESHIEKEEKRTATAAHASPTEPAAASASPEATTAEATTAPTTTTTELLAVNGKRRGEGEREMSGNIWFITQFAFPTLILVARGAHTNLSSLPAEFLPYRGRAKLTRRVRPSSSALSMREMAASASCFCSYTTKPKPLSGERRKKRGRNIMCVSK